MFRGYFTDIDTPEEVAAQQADCEAAAKVNPVIVMNVCGAEGRARADAVTARLDHERRSQPTVVLVQAPRCDGLCGLRRYQAARALDRHYNTNAGTVGWFGLPSTW